MQVDKDQYEKILKYIDIGKREGATLVAGGKPCGDKGYYIEPTIFTDVKVSQMLHLKTRFYFQWPWKQKHNYRTFKLNKYMYPCRTTWRSHKTKSLGR